MSNTYALNKLMLETRRVAAEYHRLSGQVLPVSNELARYDVMVQLNFSIPDQVESGVDLLGTGLWHNQKIQVKSRVVFNNTKSRPKVGQINFDGKWDSVILVLLNADYIAEAMYIVGRQLLLENCQKSGTQLSIGRFKAIGSLIWSRHTEFNDTTCTERK